MNQFISNLRAGWRQLEYRLAGDLPPLVRRNMHIEIGAAMFFGPLVAGLIFMPVVLRRLGASPDWLAFYTAQNFIGFMLTTFSVMVMPRQRGLIRFAALWWLASRGSFLLVAFVTRSEDLILITLFFWVAESFPIPVYTRLMQVLYPANARGRVLGMIRMGMALTNLAITPLAGWLLDTLGHRAFFPLTAACGVMSVLLFTRLKFEEADVPPSGSQSAAGLWTILRRDRRFILYLAALVCFGVGLLSGLVLFPIVQVDRLKLSYSEIGLLGFVQSISFLLSYLVLGRLIDRRGGAQTLRIIFLVGVVIPLSYMLAASGWMLAPAFAALGVVHAGLDMGTLNSVMQLSKPEELGEYSALQTTVLGIHGLVSPFIGVGLINAGLSYEATFGLGLGLMVIAAVILGWVKVD